MAGPPRTLAGAGWVQASDLPQGPDGRALCRYCQVQVPVGRKTFCSGQRATFVYRKGTILKPGTGCVHEHCVRSQPNYARKCLWARDQGQCALCPTVVQRFGPWEADHTVPVVEGGGSCGLGNLRTLCRPCHLRETAKLAARRAQARLKPQTAEPPKVVIPKVILSLV